MAKRKKRKSTRQPSRNRKVAEGRKIVSNTTDDMAAAEQLNSLFKEDVLDATDLNSAFDYFALKNNIEKRGKR